jgi:hypothetical protein
VARRTLSSTISLLPKAARQVNAGIHIVKVFTRGSRPHQASPRETFHLPRKSPMKKLPLTSRVHEHAISALHRMKKETQSRKRALQAAKPILKPQKEPSSVTPRTKTPFSKGNSGLRDASPTTFSQPTALFLPGSPPKRLETLPTLRVPDHLRIRPSFPQSPDENGHLEASH